MAEIDLIYEFDVKLVGSSNEGTRPFYPDEYDFLLVFKNMETFLNITQDQTHPSYVSIEFKENYTGSRTDNRHFALSGFLKNFWPQFYKIVEHRTMTVFESDRLVLTRIPHSAGPYARGGHRGQLDPPQLEIFPFLVCFLLLFWVLTPIKKILDPPPSHESKVFDPLQKNVCVRA